MNSVEAFCGVENERKLFEFNIGMSSLRFLGGVMVGDIGAIFVFPLKTLLTMLLLVSCCFFCRIVSARVSTFLILAALFSREYGDELGVDVGSLLVS